MRACDGQVIVLHDLLGLFDEFSPKFIKRYVNLREIISTAVTQYKDEVMNGEFPSNEKVTRACP
jgi:3-methyl-2-oxobutanoate hydroxymethyltransferase